MQDKGLYWKLGLIILMILWAFYEIIPLDTQLKGGIDLVGGYSMLYEIDTTDLSSDLIPGLSTRVMERLKVRVDPDQVRNLVWRPVGDTRLEIQMPLPPKETIVKRQAFRAKLAALLATNVRESELVHVFDLPAEAREAQLDKLVRGVPARKELFRTAMTAYDAWQIAIKAKKDADTMADLSETYEETMAAVLAVNVDRNELYAALELDPGLKEREESLSRIRDKHSGRATLLNAAIDAYDQWGKDKAPLEDPEDLKRLVRGQGRLDFRILAAASTETADEFAEYASRLKKDGPRWRSGDTYGWYEIAKPDDWKGGYTGEYAGKQYVLAYHSDPQKVLDNTRPGWKLAQAYPQRDQAGLPAVGFEFNEIGGSYFRDLTQANIGQALCILLDGQAFSAPNIRSVISRRGIIEGRFTDEEIRYLVSTLNAGSLDARLKPNPISVHSVGPSLGQDNRKAGFRAAVGGLIVVLVFMIVYYLHAGCVADVALAMNLLLLLGVMAALQATFTMAGIAAMILTMGMAVDANVLIYERIREEREKVQSLRLILKNGYERALPTILDANITTLITCVVLYYIGTEEIKGFALVLGLGLVISMFTALVVTRVVFTLLAKYNVIKRLPMLRFFKRPNFDWLSLHKKLWVLSACILIAALVLFPLRGDDKYGIEFRGGTSIQVELKSAGLMDIGEVRRAVKQGGENLMAAFEPIKQAELKTDRQQATLTFQGVSADYLTVALRSFMEDELEKGSVQQVDARTVTFRIKAIKGLNAEKVRTLIHERLAEQMRRTGDQLASAQVQTVGDENMQFSIVTVATAEEMVRKAILDVMGAKLNIQPAIKFDPAIRSFPVTERRLRDVIGEPRATGDVLDYRGGVVLVVGELDPAVTVQQVKERIDSMRYKPDFQKLRGRESDVIGLAAAAGQDLAALAEADVRYTRLAFVVADSNYPYDRDEALWKRELVEPERALLEVALRRTSEFQQVTQFAPQVASQAKMSALAALIVAFAAIIMYLWVRFGTPRHGIAAVIALCHDVLVCVAFVCAASYVADTQWGQMLLLQDFKLNLPLVAAFLTVIGYSVNDTIVVYDRIRENRGKRTDITPQIINQSFNQTLGRTVLTSLTTLAVMVVMYIFGGEGVRGFSFVMIIGTIVGTYSSMAIASPLLLGWFGATPPRPAAAAEIAPNKSER